MYREREREREPCGYTKYFHIALSCWSQYVYYKFFQSLREPPLLKNDIYSRAPSKKECITITTKSPSLRSCRVTVHIQINEPLSAVYNSNSCHLSDNAELPSPHRWENRQGLSRIFRDVKSAEYPLKESKMCIRPYWQVPKVQSLKQFCRPTKTGVKGIISILKFSTWSKGL